MTRAGFFLALALAFAVNAQEEKPNAVLLVAKPGLTDPNFRETVVLATQATDGSTVGVVLNRPTSRKDDKTGATVYWGGPVMGEVLVALYRSERAPAAAAFHVLQGIYLTMHPQNIEELVQKNQQRAPEHYRLFSGFAGWAPGQLEAELARDAWYVLPASAEIAFRLDTTRMWDELVRKARRRIASR